MNIQSLLKLSTGLNRIRDYALRQWNDFISSTLVDLRVRWRRGILWFFIIQWISSLVILMTVLSLWSKSAESGSACPPNGIFTPDLSRYEILAPSSFFQISLGFGALSFTSVKAIDTAWDIVRAPMLFLTLTGLISTHLRLLAALDKPFSPIFPGGCSLNG